MNRIDARFAELRAARRAGLIVYLTAGDPSFAETPDLLRAVAEAGADIIELGVPWSDPSADGPVIQRAMERALQNGGGVFAQTMASVAALRQSSTVPLVLFGYFNPLLQRGLAQAVSDSAQAGVDGFLVVDLPHEESDELDALAKKHQLCRIALLSPTTPPERARLIAQAGSGFLYYVALTGVTGAATLNPESVARHVESLRPAIGALPLAVGFGVRSPETARALGQVADAVVVGSALVERIAAEKNAAARRQAAASFVASLRAALER